MAPTFGESRLVILNRKTDGIIFLPGDKKTITVGSSLSCDVRYVHEEARDVHFTIYKNEKGEIKVVNNSTWNPIQVNGVEVPGRKGLASGDVISFLGKNFRWESKEDAKKRKLSLPKTEKKRQAAQCMKTKKRITIHKINLANQFEETESVAAPAAPIEDLQPMEEASQRASTMETPPDEISTLCESPTTPIKGQTDPATTFSTPLLDISRNKENSTPKLESLNLNLSGTLKTWFTPTKREKTPVKSVLSESTSNTSDGESSTPNKAKRSMHLIDLTTLHPTKTSVSSPDTLQSPKITPTKKTVVARQENMLLKSAIKNSTIKKKIEATPNRKILKFAEAEVPNDSSVIEVSSDSIGQSPSQTPKKTLNQTSDFTGLQKMLKTPQREPKNDLSDISGVAGLMKTPSSADEKPALDDDAKEVQDLIDSISSVLDDHESEHHSDESLERNASPTAAFEGNFDKSLYGNTSSPSLKVNVGSIIFDDNAVSSAESKFDNIAGTSSVEAMSSIDSKFDQLIGRPSITKTYSAKKSTQPEVGHDDEGELSREKAESILTWVAEARDSLAAESSNQTVQVTSSRYSNVTPNDSVVSVNHLAYDASTPKIVNLQAVVQLRKSCVGSNQKLTKSPVTRLSLNQSTVVVENYNMNSGMPKSLRSTRKRIGDAMFSLNNVSMLADTTIDPNETIDMSSVEPELNQSKQEPKSFLSLDNPPTSNSNGGDCDRQQSSPPSKNFIAFAKSRDDQGESDRDVFEISSNETSVEEKDSQSDVYESSSDSDGSDGVEEKSIEVNERSATVRKFRLSEQDMEEGINPLNDSRNEDDGPSSQDDEVTNTDNDETNVDMKEGTSYFPSKNQSWVFEQSTDQDASDRNNTGLFEASKVGYTNPDVPDESDVFGTDFDLPATQAFADNQNEVEQLPKEAIAPEEPIKEEVSQLNLTQVLPEPTETEEEEPSTTQNTTYCISNDSNSVDNQSPALTPDDSNGCDEDFEIPATQAYDETLPVEESFANGSTFSMLSSQDNQTVITDPKRVVPDETSLFNDSEFSRVEIPDELMETTVDTGVSSEDELKGLTDAPTFTKRAHSLLPKGDSKATTSRKTLAAKPDGEVPVGFVDKMKQQHKESLFAKMEDQPNLEAKGQRKSLVLPAPVKTLGLSKTMIPSVGALTPSFTNFMKAKAEQLKQKETSDMEVSLNNDSSGAKPQNSSVESSLRSSDIAVESSQESEKFDSSIEEISDDSGNDVSNSQEQSADAQELSQVNENVKAVVENESSDQIAVVEEVCVKKVANVCSPDKDDVEETWAPLMEIIETPSATETPSRRRTARPDYSALASGTPKRLGRPESVEVVEKTPAKPPKSAKKTRVIVKEQVSATHDTPTKEQQVAIKGKDSEPAAVQALPVVETPSRGQGATHDTPTKEQQVAIKGKDSEPAAVQALPVTETPSRRRAAKVNYLELASGTPKARGRSASVEVAVDTPAKPPKSARKAVVIDEEPENQASEPTLENTQAADNAEENYVGQSPVVEKPCVERHAYVCTPEKDTKTVQEVTNDDNVEEEAAAESVQEEMADIVQEITEPELDNNQDTPSSEVEVSTPTKAVQEPEIVLETPSRRRAVKVDYSALASGATPKKAGETPKATPSRRGRSASIDSKASADGVPASKKRVKSVRKLAPIIREEPEEKQEVVADPSEVPEESASKVESGEKAVPFPKTPVEVAGASSRGTKKRSKKVEVAEEVKAEETSTEVKIEISAKLVQEAAQPAVEIGEKTASPKAVATTHASGRQRKAARMNYTDMVEGSKPKPNVDTPEAPKSKRVQKVKAPEKTSDGTPVKSAEIATAEPEQTKAKKPCRGKKEEALAVAVQPTTPVQEPKKSKRARKEVVVESSEETESEDVENAEEPAQAKPGRAKKEVAKVVPESKKFDKVAATTSRRITKRKNMKPEEEKAPKKIIAEPSESSAAAKKNRTAQSPAEPALEPAQSSRGSKKQLAKSHSTVVISKMDPPTAAPSKQKKGLAKTQSVIELPVLTATRSLRATSRARTPQPVGVQIPIRKGRGKARNASPEPVQNVDESEEEEAPAPVKQSSRNKRKLEAEKPESPSKTPTETPTKSRRINKKQEVEKAPEQVVDELPKTTSRRNDKKVEEQPEEVVPVKASRRGAAKRVEETPEEPAAAEVVPAKKTRREVAAKKTEEPAEEAPVPAKKAKGKAKAVELVEKESEAPAKRGRGRKAATVEPESPAKVVSTPPATKRAASAKKQVSIVTPSTSEAAEVKPKRAAKRNLPAAIEEPVAKRATRARK